MENREFADRPALVTGGSRSIGRAICKLLASSGAKVAVNYVSNERAAQETLALIEEEGSEGLTIRTDVSKSDEVDRMAEADSKLVSQLISITPLKRMAQPEEIASVVEFLLSESSSYITGQTILASGGRG